MPRKCQPLRNKIKLKKNMRIKMGCMMDNSKIFTGKRIHIIMRGTNKKCSINNSDLFISGWLDNEDCTNYRYSEIKPPSDLVIKS